MAREAAHERPDPPLLIAGVCGSTLQALSEAEAARRLGYNAALVSLAAMSRATDREMILHCREIADVVPIIGFYLQPAVGGRALGYSFWREFCTIPSVVAIKIAPFNRYQTLDVIRSVAESGRAGEIALYTGNDDNILVDLLSTYRFGADSIVFAGGLLGQWAVGTLAAVGLLQEAKRARSDSNIPQELLSTAHSLTDTNSALFDASNGFRGCIAGIHEVLRRQGLLAGRWCLDPEEDLSPGQMEEIDRVLAAYPELHDDEFIRQHRDEWLR
jgi:dihydrodipicolinate synthase/N-acetylneuraminate lyase